MKNVPKIDLGLTGYDELFMNDTERMETKLPHIYDIPLELIDDFPDHPFKVRDDEDYMCELTGKTEEEIFADLKGVIFLNPMHGYGNSTQAKYLMADEYLSGNVREKLVLARKSAELYPEDYTVNVEALERVQPKDLTASEIAVRLGATWLPTEIVEQFMFEFLGTPRYAQWNIKVHFSAYTGEWNIEGKSYDRSNVKAYSTYGTGRINAYKIIEEWLSPLPGSKARHSGYCQCHKCRNSV